MGLSNDPIESIASAIKDSILPLKLGVRKVAKDIETHWRIKTNVGNNIETVAGLSSCSRKTSLPLCRVKRKSYDRHGNNTGNDGGSLASEGSENAFWREAFFGVFLFTAADGETENEMLERLSKVEDQSKGNDRNSANGSQAGMTWSLTVNRLVQEFPSLLKIGKTKSETAGDEDEPAFLHSFVDELKLRESREVMNPEETGQQNNVPRNESITQKGKHASCKTLVGFIFNRLNRNLQKLDPFAQERAHDGCFDRSNPSTGYSQNDHLKTVNNVWDIQKVDVTGFFGNLKFAKVRGLHSGVVGIASSIDVGSDDGISTGNEDDSSLCVNSPRKLVSVILSTSSSNMEWLRSLLSNDSGTKLAELLPQSGCSSTDHPNKDKPYPVQDFFRYTEVEGKKFFEELDRDSDGRVTLEDLEMAMRKRKLPKRYAKEVMHRTRSHLFSGSFGWKQFQSFMEQKEPTVLQAYISLCLTKSGTLQKSEILASLKNAGMPSNDENAVAMMRFLTMNAEEPVSYVHFRNFMLLLPSDRLKADTWSTRFKAAPVAPSSRFDAGSLLKSALAGGVSCAFSAFLMHPVDTIKTQVQASSTLSFLEILSKIPEIGARGLYKGSIPAVAGQFASHGLRTSIHEASRLALLHIYPTLPDIQVQSIASFIGTFLGTAMRIPCEVVKQRLQANLFDNVVEATIATRHQDGLRGFFRGTGVTLLREVPFYVAGMGLYNESKKVVERQLGRELEPWETIAVGALSGGFTAVLTTPFDVIKTRMMTAPQGLNISMWMAAYSILTREGPLAFYKGAVPRFFWTAPLGALNLAGYELLRKALDKTP